MSRLELWYCDICGKRMSCQENQFRWCSASHNKPFTESKEVDLCDRCFGMLKSSLNHKSLQVLTRVRNMVDKNIDLKEFFEVENGKETQEEK